VVPVRCKGDSQACLAGAIETEVDELWVKRWFTAAKTDTEGSMSVKFV
jgi:hypothetical protein